MSSSTSSTFDWIDGDETCSKPAVIAGSMDWYPARLFNGPNPPERPYVVILLNQPLNVQSYRRVMRRASMIICADGGANRWRDMYAAAQPSVDRYPDVVVGDLDSLQDDVRDLLEIAGQTRIVQVVEQDSTDFMKALRWLKQHGGHLGDHIDVVAFGGFGGRVDQGLSMIHHLVMAVRDPKWMRGGDMYLLSEQSLSFVLKTGQNRIHDLLTDAGSIFSENVGILPVCGPARVTTTGLEWDVQEWQSEFGGQVSTSNHVKKDQVNVDTSLPVLFTVELGQALQAQQRS